MKRRLLSLLSSVVSGEALSLPEGIVNLVEERRLISKKIGLGESKWILTESGAVALAILLQDATQAEGDSGVDFPQKNAEEEFKTIKDNYLREINELKEEKTDSESALHEILQRISNSIDTSNPDIYLQRRIKQLHEYNEMKDLGQSLIGKWAELDGRTTRAMYEELNLEIDD